MSQEIAPADLRAIAQMFRYPDAQTLSAPIPEEMGAEARALLTKRRGIEPLGFESEYIRLFVNSLPELPCAPYGSVYLEGTVMGVSTVQVAKIYEKYGLQTDEMPDHIAVQCQFLAWLREQAEQSAEAREDYAFLLDHLGRWLVPFLERVEQHDRLGWYRDCALWVSRVFVLQQAGKENGKKE